MAARSVAVARAWEVRARWSCSLICRETIHLGLRGPWNRQGWKCRGVGSNVDVRDRRLEFIGNSAADNRRRIGKAGEKKDNSKRNNGGSEASAFFSTRRLFSTVNIRRFAFSVTSVTLVGDIAAAVINDSDSKLALRTRPPGSAAPPAKPSAPAAAKASEGAAKAPEKAGAGGAAKVVSIDAFRKK